MPSPINQGLITRGLVELLGLKGKFGPQADETIVATIVVDEFRRSPFQATKPCGLGDAVGAVALENGYVGVLPNSGVILCIDRIIVSQGATQPVTIRRLTAANLVTIGAPFASQFLRDFNNIEPPQANGPRTSSLLETNSFAGAVGDEVATSTALANNQVFFEFPDGYFLHGDDPAGINMLAVVGIVNLGITASFSCREFRLPG